MSPETFYCDLLLLNFVYEFFWLAFVGEKLKPSATHVGIHFLGVLPFHSRHSLHFVCFSFRVMLILSKEIEKTLTFLAGNLLACICHLTRLDTSIIKRNRRLIASSINSSRFETHLVKIIFHLQTKRAQNYWFGRRSARGSCCGRM